MRSPLRVGVVGLGVISRFYLRALEESASMRLAAVCDRDPAVLAAHSGRAPGYTDHRRLLEEGGVDAVVVTAPNDVHARVCADALERGAAVCVEKPLALNVAEGRALTALAQDRGAVLFTAFHRRYNSAVARLRAALAHARVEELTVRYLERIEEHAGTDTWYLDARRCGGGCVADNGPNAFDLVDLLLGPADVVSARIARDGAGTDRQADIALRAGGTRARVLLDWSYEGERKDVRARLADGRTLSADMLAGHPGFKDSLWHEYAGILDAFERRVRGGSQEGTGGLAALALVEEAYRLEEPVAEEVAG
ncbi:putative dehydrogenase [Nocardiopsis sp. Huas11]|uniref:Gfo/Idh/MocA family protein n=1 Tax=Nocardiopsis sp. Huas11 TaxID=2183912 RepID=UPI000EADEF24|nr:Gfo/Idh/MocA family oxidoreductase [Nocardiopsis sp. Huas11]RKS09717.1 putative dehydrogenase [Nocardiopsis sp. Huas11]